MDHVKLKRNPRFMSRKKSLSHHHAMPHFHTITLIILLFHESHLEQRAIHATRHAPLSHYHAKYSSDSQIAPWKKDQSRYHTNLWECLHTSGLIFLK